VHAWVASDGAADPAEIVGRSFDLFDAGLASFDS
jgi:hypothetical protein